MAAIDFPASPAVGQQFTAGNGATYQWSGAFWFSVGTTSSPPSGAAGGALAGTYPNPSLVGGPLSAYLPLAGGTMSGWIVAPSFVGIADLNDYALSLGRYSAGFGRAAINTQGNYGYEFQVNGSTAFQIDAALVTFPGNIASGGGITNGFEWAGWLYNTTNMNAYLPTHHQGLATAWNYDGTGWQNYINGWPSAGHHFQTWTDTTYTALTDAPVMFQTPAAATEDHTGATTAFVKQRGATATNLRATLGASVPMAVQSQWYNGPTTGAIGAAGQVWALMCCVRVDVGGTGAIDFILARIYDGVNNSAADITVAGLSGTNIGCPINKVFTLTGPTTFTLQCQDPSSTHGTLNMDSHILAMRIA